MNSIDTHWQFAINKKVAKTCLGGFLLLMLVYSIAAPIYCDYKMKVKVAEIMVMLSAPKVEVNEIIENTPEGQEYDFSKVYLPLPSRHLIKMNSEASEPILIEHYDISPKGKIMVLVSGLNMYVELVPTIDNGKVVEWQCYGKPTKIMLAECRTEKTHNKALNVNGQPPAAAH